MAKAKLKPSKRGLGKGLSALISDTKNKPAAKEKEIALVSETQSPGVDTLAITQLASGKYQPRRQFSETAMAELAESIEKNGIMQPIVVRPVGKAGNYEIVAGERRWRAAKIAGLARVPVIVRELTDRQALELALVENIQRQDLAPLEEAGGYQRLMDDFGYTQGDLSGVVGKSRSHIANLLRLLALPDEVKEMLNNGELTPSHARALLNASDPLALARMIVARGLNVRQAERIAQGAAIPDVKPSRRGSRQAANVEKDADILALEASLSENMGLKVAINDRGQSGEIVIAYESLSQLDEILRKLGNEVGEFV